MQKQNNKAQWILLQNSPRICSRCLRISEQEVITYLPCIRVTLRLHQAWLPRKSCEKFALLSYIMVAAIVKRTRPKFRVTLVFKSRLLKPLFTCAILICKSSAIAKYHAFTPNLPEATCLIADLFSGSLPLIGSSPPSPVLLLPPILKELAV